MECPKPREKCFGKEKENKPVDASSSIFHASTSHRVSLARRFKQDQFDFGTLSLKKRNIPWSVPCNKEMNMSERGDVKLVSMDGEVFTVNCNILSLSQLLEEMISVSESGDEIPIPNIKGKTLKKVIEYCTAHKDRIPPEIEKPLKSANFAECVSEEDYKFVDIDQESLFELILAANFLNIKPLLDLTCGKVASMIKGKKVEEIRRIFNIVNDFTPEQEAQIRDENKWCENA